MGSFKALGKDGLQPIFYKSQWSIVGALVTNLIKEMFMQPAKVEEINKTLIALIPKKENATKLSQFRPISLCYTSYENLTKVLAQRLKNVMEKLINP